MGTGTFDTHTMVRMLTAEGIAENQAAVIVNAIQKSHHHFDEVREEEIDRLATKADLAVIKAEIENMRIVTGADIDSLRQETKAELGTVRSEMREVELRNETRLKDVQLKLGAMIFALGGILIAVKYFG